VVLSTTPTPSLASNVSQRVFSASALTPCHPFPLPGFKRKSEGMFLVFTHTTSPISKCESEGMFLVITHMTSPIPPSSLQMQVGGDIFSLHVTVLSPFLSLSFVIVLLFVVPCLYICIMVRLSSWTSIFLCLICLWTSMMFSFVPYDSVWLCSCAAHGPLARV
jgi:hypothetical protein